MKFLANISAMILCFIKLSIADSETFCVDHKIEFEESEEIDVKLKKLTPVEAMETMLIICGLLPVLAALAFVFRRRFSLASKMQPIC